MKATKVDGIYDKDPLTNSDAKRYKTLRYQEAIEKENIQIMDTAALVMAKENNMPIMVFKLFEGENLEKAVNGEDVGTYMSNEVESVFA